MTEILAHAPWVACLAIAAGVSVKVIDKKDLPFHGKVICWTIIVFFWVTIAVMIKELFGL